MNYDLYSFTTIPHPGRAPTVRLYDSYGDFVRELNYKEGKEFLVKTKSELEEVGEIAKRTAKESKILRELISRFDYKLKDIDIYWFDRELDKLTFAVRSLAGLIGDLYSNDNKDIDSAIDDLRRMFDVAYPEVFRYYNPTNIKGYSEEHIKNKDFITALIKTRKNLLGSDNFGIGLIELISYWIKSVDFVIDNLDYDYRKYKNIKAAKLREIRRRRLDKKRKVY